MQRFLYSSLVYTIPLFYSFHSLYTTLNFTHALRLAEFSRHSRFIIHLALNCKLKKAFCCCSAAAWWVYHPPCCSAAAWWVYHPPCCSAAAWWVYHPPCCSAAAWWVYHPPCCSAAAWWVYHPPCCSAAAWWVYHPPCCSAAAWWVYHPPCCSAAAWWVYHPPCCSCSLQNIRLVPQFPVCKCAVGQVSTAGTSDHLMQQVSPRSINQAQWCGVTVCRSLESLVA